jgi:hypothetical protein
MTTQLSQPGLADTPTTSQGPAVPEPERAAANAIRLGPRTRRVIRAIAQPSPDRRSCAADSLWRRDQAACGEHEASGQLSVGDQFDKRLACRLRSQLGSELVTVGGHVEA